MARFQAERTGVLVLRIWIEDEPTGVVKARISSTTSVDSVPPVTAVAGSLEDVEAMVAALLALSYGSCCERQGGAVRRRAGARSSRSRWHSP